MLFVHPFATQFVKGCQENCWKSGMKLEQRAAGILSALILLFWLAICITDVNHPPGVRYVRLAAAALVLLAGGLELWRRWWGIGLFLLIWPHCWMLRPVLSDHLSPLFAALPEFWGGPMAAALAVGVWLHGERSLLMKPRQEDLPARGASPLALPSPQRGEGGVRGSGSGRWLAAFRAAFRVLLAAWFLSVVCALVRLHPPPPGFTVQQTDFRHLLWLGPFSSMAPLLSLTQAPPALLLGLLLLNALNDTAPQAIRTWSLLPGLLYLGCFSVALGLAKAALQLRWSWVYDPFPNRNITAVVMAVCGLLLLTLTPRLVGSLKKILLVAVSAAMLLLACAIGSRNGAFVVLASMWLALFLKARPWALVLACVLPLLALILLWWLPPPQPGENSDTTVQRSMKTIADAREGRWEDAVPQRLAIYQTALQLAARYPLLGSGPQTFVMFANDKDRFRFATQQSSAESVLHAHSVPLQLCAEIGLPGALAWLAIWFVLPWMGMLRWERGNGLALAVLALGVGNLFDAVWLIPGVATFGVLTVVAACACRAGPGDDSVVPS